MKRREKRTGLVAVLILSCLRVAVGNQYFFTNTNDILKLTDDQSLPEILYTDSDHPQALDYNSCQGSQGIYWISLLDGRIHRGNPNGEGQAENVISDDVVRPKGIAVDYIGSNIYFSQQTNVRSKGRIEVVTCDGSHRKVLQTGLLEGGPLALDIVNGHLYYADGPFIKRIDTNGKHKTDVTQAVSNVTGLAVDSSLNRLYWTSNGKIWFIDFSQENPSPQTISLDPDSVPYGVSATDGTLYWTVLGNNVTSVPGAIYMLVTTDDSSSAMPLHVSADIHPRDVSVSSDLPLLEEGCGDQNGGCDQFCFSVPSPTGEGTQPECGCKTGIVENSATMQCPRVPTHFFLFGRKITDSLTRISMVSLDADSDISVLLPFQIPRMGANYLAYDVLSRTVYWDEIDPPAIMRSIVDSSEVETFISTDIRRVSGLAIDLFGRNLYWSDSALDRIEVVSLSFDETDIRRARKVIVTGDIHTPQSLSLDLHNGFMYWIDRESGQPRIERARLDGTERKVFYRGNSYAPTFLVANPSNGDVFWSDATNDGRISTNTSNMGKGFDVIAFSVHGLAIVDDELYWTDGLDGKIGMATIQAGPEVRRGTSTFLDNIDGVGGIVAVDSDHFIDNNLCGQNYGCSHICLFSGGSATCVCPDGFRLREGSDKICIESDGYAVIATKMTEPDKVVHSLDLYTRSVNILTEKWDIAMQCANTTYEPHCSEEVEIVTMAIHLLGNTTIDVYYVDGSDMLIYRRSITTGTPKFLIGDATPIISCCLATPESLAVDWLGRNLYWTDSTRGVIEVSLLSGDSRRVLYSDLDSPSLLVLDPRRGDLYFTRANSQAIYRRKMDGSSQTSENICDTCAALGHPITGEVLSLSIDFDPSPRFHDKLVWSYVSGSDTVTVTYDLDGAASTPVFRTSVDPPPFVHSLYFNGSLYFHRGDNSQSIVKWNGAEKNVLSYNINDFFFTYTQFSIAHPWTQPGYHECTAREVCTGHYPLCLVQDHIYGSCHCPFDSFKKIHEDLLLGQRTESCAQAKSFIIFATQSDIYYYPLPSDLTDPEVTSEPLIVPRGNHGDVVAVTYDPYSQSIIWLEKDTNLLYSVSVEGLESRILGKFPDRVGSLRSMTLDWIGGHILFTETTGYQIEAAGVRGGGEEEEGVLNLIVGSLVSAYLEGSVVSPNQPRDVLFDETSRSVIWQEERKEIFKTVIGSLRDSLSPLLAESEDRTIDFLTFDPSIGYIYWWNRKANKIEGLNINNNDVITFVSGVSNVTGLTANNVSDTSNLIFWYDMEEGAVFYCSVTRKLDDRDFECRQKYLSWSPSNQKDLLFAMTSFDMSRYSAISTPYECRSGNKECQYLCVEEKGTAECKCPLFRTSVDREESKCSEVACPQFHTSCGDNLACFPNTYACDGIQHCTNGFDEQNCAECDEGEGYIPCGPGNEGLCYLNTSRCDGVTNCPASLADELICCKKDLEFGCYTQDEGHYRCYQKNLRCDASNFCQDYITPDECEVSTQPPPGSKDPSTSGSANYVTIITVTTIFAMLAFFVFVILCVSVRCIARQKRRRQRFHFPPTSKAGSSPPPRSDISSIYSGMSSLGTESTTFPCGSPHPDPFVKTAVFHPERSTHISNPPPSLITAARRQSQLLEGEEESQTDPCPPPCPSVDWENMSALSYSASQGGMRLPAMNGGGPGGENYYTRPPGFRDHHHPQAENPLHYHHMMNHGGGFRGNNTHVYHHPHGNGRPYGGSSSVGTSLVSQGAPPRRGDHHHHYPPISMSRLRANARGVYPSDLPNYEEAETETVFSQSTIQTENGSHFPFDDRTPPGRPPSPATVTEYSERDLQQRVPLSPTSEYTEEEGEGGGTTEGESINLHEDEV